MWILTGLFVFIGMAMMYYQKEEEILFESYLLDNDSSISSDDSKPKKRQLKDWHEPSWLIRLIPRH